MSSDPLDAWQLGPATRQLAERARRVMPGRQSNLRAADEPPVFVVRGEGQRMWDVDGRELLDFALGMGPNIWGHGNREYLAAVHAQLDQIFNVAAGMLQTPNEVFLAEKIVEHVPCAEQVRFLTSGSEAVQLVIRLARAFTGRPRFVRFDGNYHGWIDNVLGGRSNPDATAVPYAVESPDDPMHTEGRSPIAFDESFKIPWNDIERLEALLAERGHEIALVIMEAAMTNGGCCLPRPGYLERVRELCTQHGVLLCIDEVITGFRMGLGGAQQHYGVTPDLSTFGKALAGGMALAAVAGRHEILELLRTNRVVNAGTFNAAPASMAAGVATLSMLERDGGAAFRRIDTMQSALMAGIRERARRRGHAVLVQGVRGVFCVHFTELPIAHAPRELALHADLPKARRFRQLLIREGLYPGRGDRYFVSTVLSEAELEEALRRIDAALVDL
jgi:glutamate-1-semialdehyde 2,1-aminomutase